MKKWLLVASALTAIGLANPAAAAKMDSPSTCALTDVTAEGQNALDCEVYDGNDQLGGDPDGYTVNENDMFGHNDWQFLGKDEESGSTGSAGLEVTGIGDLSGLWEITEDLLLDYEEFAIILKAGSEFAAYLFSNTDADDGTWSSFNGKDLSHLTLYARGEGNGGGGGGGGEEPGGGGEEPNEVPEPAALGLFGLGLLGVAIGRRRRKA